MTSGNALGSVVSACTEGREDEIPVWGHRKVPQNLAKLSSDLGPMLMRRVVASRDATVLYLQVDLLRTNL